MANTTAAVPVQTAPVSAELGTGAGNSASGKSVARSGGSNAADGFHKLMASQGGKEDQGQQTKQPADSNDQLSAILALLASLGMVQQPPQADLTVASDKTMLATQGKLTVQGMQALSGLQLSQTQTATGLAAQQASTLLPGNSSALKDITQNDINILQQLLAEIAPEGAGRTIDGNSGALQALIQQMSKQNPSAELSGQDVASAIKSMLDSVKRASPAVDLQASATASVYSALQQAKSTGQNLTNAVQSKQNVPAIRTQLSAWQHQLKVQADATALGADPQQQNAGKDSASLTVALQTPVGVALGNQMTTDSAVRNLRIPASELPQQIQSLLVKNASLQEQGGSRVFRITLVPEGLGEIQVMVSGDAAQNQISVQFLTDRAQTQDLLNSSLPTLRSDLEALGVHLHKVEVDFGSSSSSQQGNMGNSGFLSQNSSSNPQGFSGGNQRQPSDHSLEASAVREEWSMLEEFAGADSSAQINLTA